MSVLLVGFDSAWTADNSGAIIGALCHSRQTFEGLGVPTRVNFLKAEEQIDKWQRDFAPSSTIVFLDQPTIVKNLKGQRPVERIVCSAVCRRGGGMQPAYAGRREMFGKDAPVWRFLDRFGGPADPFDSPTKTRVYETYPVLTLIALEWMRSGRLPKYNPSRRKTFSMCGWRHVSDHVWKALDGRGLTSIVGWLQDVGNHEPPRKSDQDGVDACLCLLAAIYLVEGKECLIVGNCETGYIVVPHNPTVYAELVERCRKLAARTHEREWEPQRWVRVLEQGQMA